ncbi:MAG: hypothetical protein RIR46_1270 [Actinomycetota bacterium]
MTKKTRGLTVVLSAYLTFIAVSAGNAVAATPKPVFVETSTRAATLKPLVTAGDRVGSFLVPGLLDGTGAYSDAQGLHLLSVSEFPYAVASTAKFSYARGQAQGSPITHFVVDPKTRAVKSASSAIKDVLWYNYATKKHGETPVAPNGAASVDLSGVPQHSRFLDRFCSATLRQTGAFTYRASDSGALLGYSGRVFLTGEETGDEGRAFALNSTGQLVQLPKLGLGSWENLTPALKPSLATVVIGTEDNAANNSQLRLYVGKKLAAGKWFERAGLHNGKSYVMEAGEFADDTDIRASVSKGTPISVRFNEVDNTVDGSSQNFEALLGGTTMSRLEDGVFDPSSPNDFYFTTTESSGDAKATKANPATPKIKRDGGALWRLRFKDAAKPLSGATLTMILDGSEAPYLNKPDNLEIDVHGNIFIEEDPGINEHRSRLIVFQPATSRFTVLATAKQRYFAALGADYLTNNEELTSVVDVSRHLRTSTSDKKTYLVFSIQVHTEVARTRPDITNAAALGKLWPAFRGGQLYLMIIDWSKLP